MKNILTLLFIIFIVKADEIWEANALTVDEIRLLPGKDYDEGIGMLKNVIKLLYEYDIESRNLPTLIDIGANVGKITKEMADIYLNAKIYAFEPFKLSLDVLSMKNMDNPNVEIIVEAVSNETTTNKPFYSMPTWNAPQNTISSLSNYMNGSSIMDYTNLTTLPQFMERKGIIYIYTYINIYIGIKEVFFLKIDAEGYDGIIIKNSMNLFYQHKIKYLYFEYIDIWNKVDPNLNFYEIVNNLKAAGYNLYLDYQGNFVPLKIDLDFAGIVNVFVVLKGQSFERNLMKRLCPYCGY